MQQPGYKDIAAYTSGEGVCYVPEHAEENSEHGRYTRAMFLDLVNGNVQRADILFGAVDWQFPETLLIEEDWDHCLFGEPGDDWYIPE